MKKIYLLCLIMLTFIVSNQLMAQQWPPERKDVVHYVATPFNYDFELGLCPCLQGDPNNKANCFGMGLNAEWEYLVRVESTDQFELGFPTGFNQDTISRSPSVIGTSKHIPTQFTQLEEYSSAGFERTNYASTFISVVESETPGGITTFTVVDTFRYISYEIYQNYFVQGQSGARNLYGQDIHNYNNAGIINNVEFCNYTNHYLPFMFLLLNHDYANQGLGNEIYTDSAGGYLSHDYVTGNGFTLLDTLIQNYQEYHVSESATEYGWNTSYQMIGNPGGVTQGVQSPQIISMPYDSYIVGDTFNTTQLSNLPELFIYNFSSSDTSFTGDPPVKYFNHQYPVKVKQYLPNHTSFLTAIGDSITCVFQGIELDHNNFFTHLDAQVRNNITLFGDVLPLNVQFNEPPASNSSSLNIDENPATIILNNLLYYPYGEFNMRGFYYDPTLNFCTYEFENKITVFDPTIVTAGPDVVICDDEIGFLQPYPDYDEYSNWSGGGSNLIVSDEAIVPFVLEFTGIDSFEFYYEYDNGCLTIDTVNVAIIPTPKIDSNYSINVLSVDSYEVCMEFDLSPLGLSNSAGDTVGITIETNYYLEDNSVNYCHTMTSEIDTINYSIIAGNQNDCNSMLNGFLILTHNDTTVNITDTLLQIDTLVQVDTLVTIDTLTIIDTLVQYDTTIVNDTTIIIDTTLIFDTITLMDTLVINQTDTLIEIDYQEIIETISTTLTPNGDGINDTWIIPGLNVFDKKIATIYNRWGAVVYKNENYDNSFNGYSNMSTIGSNQLSTGTYYYHLQVEKDGLQLTKTGYLFIKH